MYFTSALLYLVNISSYQFMVCFSTFRTSRLPDRYRRLSSTEVQYSTLEGAPIATLFLIDWFSAFSSRHGGCSRPGRLTTAFQNPSRKIRGAGYQLMMVALQGVFLTYSAYIQFSPYHTLIIREDPV